MICRDSVTSFTVRRAPGACDLIGRYAAGLLLAVSLAVGAANGVEPSAVFEAGRPFSLRVGESAQMRDGGLRVGFDGVGADSRCPKGEQCVWAGDASVRVWLQRTGVAEREWRELHTSAVAATGASGTDAGLRLVRLDPVPVAGRTLLPREYVATLMITRGVSSAAER